MAQTERQKLALEHIYKVMQEAIVNPEIGISFRKGEKRDPFDKAIMCVFQTWRKTNQRISPDEIKNGILTSRARIEGWLTYNHNLSGGTYSFTGEELRSNLCPF